MTNVPIDKLFESRRLPPGLYVLPLLCYAPIGILLSTLRFFIGIHVFLISCILPKMNILRRLVLRIMCGILGVVINISGSEHRDNKVKVMIANYTTTLDHLAVDLVLPSILPCVWDLPPALMWLLGYADMGAKQGRDVLINNAKAHVRDSPVPMLVFPEGASTNGQVGLLKFSVWPFSLDQPIQPVIINITRPSMALISPSVLGGRWWVDIFWFLFVPYTKFHIRVLPVMTVLDGESPGDMTVRVQRSMADVMSVAATTHTSADKVEYAKRTLFIQPRGDGVQVRPVSPAGNDHQIRAGSQQQAEVAAELMTKQVKDVLPQCPIDVIRKDLLVTKDVDQTLTRLLEGVVKYSTVTTTVAPPEKVQLPTISPKLSDTAAKTFSGKPQDRQLSLEERKHALIESARKKYMAKHGML